MINKILLISLLHIKGIINANTQTIEYILIGYGLFKYLNFKGLRLLIQTVQTGLPGCYYEITLK